MSPAIFTCCSECGKKLRTTFFCQDCGRPACSLDCYCRHAARHDGNQQVAQDRADADTLDSHLEQAQ
jgi:hypothetical protein